MHRLLRPGLFALALSPLLATAGTTVPGEQVLAVAQQQLQRQAAGIDARWEFTPVGAVAASSLAEEGDLQIAALAVDGRWPRSRVGVAVELKVDGVSVQTRMVWFTVQAWHDALVYVQDQQVGDASDAITTRTASVDLAALGTQALRSSPLEPGLRLNRAVRAGQAVRNDDLAPVPAVARNTQVRLRVQRGDVALNTLATARADAATGQQVDVLPSGANQWITARVIGRNEVEIEN